VRTPQIVLRSLAVASLLVASVATTAQAASAKGGAENLAAEKAVLSKVVTASNPNVVYNSLSASDKGLLKLAMTHQTATSSGSVTGKLSPAEVRAAVAAGKLSKESPMAAGGCWFHYQQYTWSDLTYSEGQTWFQLNWCSDGSNVSSYYPSNIGGRGLGGVSYDGVVGQYDNNVGWEARYAIAFHFDFFGVGATPCMQIRGGKTGLWSAQQDCNLN
jgi:hypothetical protein